MDNYDSTVLNRISTHLSNFKKKSGGIYNFKCLYCGDSTKDKTKARGYIFSSKKDNSLVVKCHNCSISVSFKHFLSDHFPTEYTNYLVNKFQDKYNPHDTVYTAPKVIPVFKPEIFESTKNLLELHKNHQHKLYIRNRKIPQKYYKEIFLIQDYKHFTNQLIPNKFVLNNYKDSRLTVPLVLDDVLIGYQGRTIDSNSNLRYITIMLDNTKPKVWGFDNIHRLLPVYVTEGIFDAMFIDNAIAMLGADLSLEFLSSHPDINFIFVFDNEPRNFQIVNRMRKVVELGYSVVVWNSSITSKDINDYVLSGGMVDDVTRHYYKGIRATLKINKWSKI